MSNARLFTPLRVGKVELANRIVIAPMCKYSAAVDRLYNSLYSPPWTRSRSSGSDHRVTTCVRFHAGSARSSVSIFVAKFTEGIYVLHAFQKKSRKTAGIDIELARSRLKTVQRSRAEG